MQLVLFNPLIGPLAGATISGWSEPGSDSNEGVLRAPQSPNITGTSPSDCLVSYPGHSSGRGFTPLKKCSRCFLQPQPTGQCCLRHFSTCDVFTVLNLWSRRSSLYQIEHPSFKWLVNLDLQVVEYHIICKFYYTFSFSLYCIFVLSSTYRHFQYLLYEYFCFLVYCVFPSIYFSSMYFMIS